MNEPTEVAKMYHTEVAPKDEEPIHPIHLAWIIPVSLFGGGAGLLLFHALLC